MDTHTHMTTTVTLAAHACRGLMKSWVGIVGGKVRRNVLCGDECENVSHVLWD